VDCSPTGPRPLTRRAFVGLATAGVAGLFGRGEAENQESSTVVLARSADLETLFGTPSYDRLLDVVSMALVLLSGETNIAAARRQYYGINDRVGVQISTSPVAVTPEVVDAVITTVARAGVATDRLFIYSADERDLFRAGFALRDEGPGVRCYGANSEGYRDSLTNLLSPVVTAIANVPCLAPHPQAGLAGAIHNFVNSVTPSRAQEAVADGGAGLPSILAKRGVRDRSRLHVMDCLRPAYDLPADGPPARWEYNGLLVSTDPVALDAVGTALLQAKRREVAGAEWPLDPFPTHVELAASKYGLGTADLASINLLRVGPMEDALI
jgi:hypothetical protein